MFFVMALPIIGRAAISLLSALSYQKAYKTGLAGGVKAWSITNLVLGIVALIFFFWFPFMFLGAIISIVMGILGIVAANQLNEPISVNNFNNINKLDSLEEQLMNLNALYDRGVISKTEYETRRALILSRDY
jgi:hypothetical protein